MLNEKDKLQIAARNISEDTIIKQVDRLNTGFIPAQLISPAVPGNGVIVTTEKTRQYYTHIYDDYSRDKVILKFVPASGAASRMFKEMFACLEAMNQSSIENPDIPEQFPKVRQIMEQLHEFALFPDLETYFDSNGLQLPMLMHNRQFKLIMETILLDHGLNYGNLPKALLNFHNYGSFQRKAVDEHLVEGALYAVNANGKVNIHFTISPEHEEMFREHLKNVIPLYENRFGLTYDVTWSFQHPSTDTPAVDMNGNLMREADGSLVFRPAGHGALIKNLNDIDGDLIFIKNIDNVTTDKLRATTVEYKKVLAGILIEKEITINGNLSILMDDGCTESDINEIAEFVKTDMLVSMPDQFHECDIDQQRRILTNKLNKPIRVCGMVKNEGEPGGGPFFVKNTKGITSLQIVESAQVDMINHQQKEIFSTATHFNPVDIVAGTVDFLGRKFDLNDFIDHDTYMISEKSKDGKPLKALELPGLWNGAMAGWITYFVEVPLETFSPVKEINDLLRPQHII
jgi:hypothetical protein